MDTRDRRAIAAELDTRADAEPIAASSAKLIIPSGLNPSGEVVRSDIDTFIMIKITGICIATHSTILQIRSNASSSLDNYFSVV
jgi:hypothetical protein